MQPPRYALAAYDPDASPCDEIWALCADAEHLFADQPPGVAGALEGRDGAPEELAEPPVRLLGCSPRGALREALAAGKGDLGHGTVLRLGRQGQTLQYAVEGEVVAWIPSARGRGLVDLALDPWTVRPPRAAGEVWDVWWRGRPTEPNLWARHGTEGRTHWLAVAQEASRRHGPNSRPRLGPNHRPQPGPNPEPDPGPNPEPDPGPNPEPDPGPNPEPNLEPAPEQPATMRHLDGRHITDEPAFYCALGEAMNGPGGYFGRNVDTLSRCLSEAPGARPPFTLVWHDARTARTCLGVTPRTDRRPPSFEELVDFLVLMDVEVVLD
ncbi:barstar family protein [Streptomyces sp. NPDC041068]|uniref:barstar family protein n=1 Tax=Streptomyces sp. NPDC041068 TaxID=3155130 RepID=UPI0033EC3168